MPVPGWLRAVTGAGSGSTSTACSPTRTVQPARNTAGSPAAATTTRIQGCRIVIVNYLLKSL